MRDFGGGVDCKVAIVDGLSKDSLLDAMPRMLDVGLEQRD